MNRKNNSNQAVTKADFQTLMVALKKFATNKDLKKTEKNLRVEILKVEERVENLEEGQKRLEKGQENLSKKFDNLYNLVLEFLGRTNNLEKENELGANQIHDLREKTADHEKRISKLEATAQST